MHRGPTSPDEGTATCTARDALYARWKTAGWAKMGDLASRKNRPAGPDVDSSFSAITESAREFEDPAAFHADRVEDVSFHVPMLIYCGKALREPAGDPGADVAHRSVPDGVDANGRPLRFPLLPRGSRVAGGFSDRTLYFSRREMMGSEGFVSGDQFAMYRPADGLGLLGTADELRCVPPPAVRLTPAPGDRRETPHDAGPTRPMDAKRAGQGGTDDRRGTDASTELTGLTRFVATPEKDRQILPLPRAAAKVLSPDAAAASFDKRGNVRFGITDGANPLGMSTARMK